MTPAFDISNYIFLLAVLICFYAPIRAIFCAVKRRKYKLNPMREAVLFIFAAFVFITAYRLVCPYFEVDFYDNLKIIPQEENSYIPFDKIFDGIGTVMAGGISGGLGDILRPIIIFVPIGFLLGLCWNIFYKKLLVTAIFSFVFGLLLQIPQIWTYRGFATDHAIMYALGSVLGVLLLRAVEKFAHNRPKFQPIHK